MNARWKEGVAIQSTSLSARYCINSSLDACAGLASGSQPENSKARLYQYLLVTIPAQNSQAGRVKSVDANGQLVVELGTLNASNHFDVNAGTTLLVRVVCPTHRLTVNDLHSKIHHLSGS